MQMANGPRRPAGDIVVEPQIVPHAILVDVNPRALGQVGGERRRGPRGPEHPHPVGIRLDQLQQQAFPGGRDFAGPTRSGAIPQAGDPLRFVPTDRPMDRDWVHPDESGDGWRRQALVRQQDDVTARSLGCNRYPSKMGLQRRHLASRERTDMQRSPHDRPPFLGTGEIVL